MDWQQWQPSESSPGAINEIKSALKEYTAYLYTQEISKNRSIYVNWRKGYSEIFIAKPFIRVNFK